jgi:phasin family protein
MVAKAKKPAAAAVEAGEVAGLPALPKPVPVFPYEALAQLGRDNFAAVLKANGAVAEGLEAISNEVMGYAKASLESAGQAAKALLAVKTLEDVVQLQMAYARATIGAFVDRSAKLSELGVKVANEALAPLGGRVEATFARLGKPAAA